MDLNQVLIALIGVFVMGISAMWLKELKKQEAEKNKSNLAKALMVAGILIVLYPIVFMNENTTNSALVDSTSQVPQTPDGTKEIVIGDDFIKDRIKSDTSYAHYVSRQWYAEAVQKWNDRTFRYDSVELVIEQLQKSIEFYEMAMAHEAMGQALIQQGQIKRGIDEYTRAIEMDPNLGAAYFNRGTAYYILNQPENYCPDWIKALELGVPNAVDATRTYCGY